LYGLLLEESGIDWKTGISFTTHLADLLQEAMEISELTPIEQINLETYGYSQVKAVETAWLIEFDKMMQTAADTLAFGKPFLQLDGRADLDYDDNFKVLTLPVNNLVYYGDFSLTGSFGRIEFREGFVRVVFGPNSHRVSSVNMRIEENRAAGPGWSLLLNEGYTIEPFGPRDFRAIKKED
jgi:hypothetical protein